MLLSEAFACYRRDVIVYRNQARKTEENHNVTAKTFIRFVGDIEVSQLTFEQIRSFTEHLRCKGRSENTIRGYIIKIRNVIGYLNLLGIDTIKKDLINVPRRVETAPTVIDASLVEKLIKSTSMTRNKAIIALFYSSGIRVSELCALNISDIREDTFTVNGKGNKLRPCFIDKRAKYWIEVYLSERTDNHEALFLTQTGERMTSGRVQEIFKYMRKAAKIKQPIHPHTMRHSYAVNLLKNGCHLFTLSKLMGHSSVQTTQAYLQLEDPELKEAYQKYHTIL